MPTGSNTLKGGRKRPRLEFSKTLSSIFHLSFLLTIQLTTFECPASRTLLKQGITDGSDEPLCLPTGLRNASKNPGNLDVTLEVLPQHRRELRSPWQLSSVYNGCCFMGTTVEVQGKLCQATTCRLTPETPTSPWAHVTLMLGDTSETSNKGLLEISWRQTKTSETLAFNNCGYQHDKLLTELLGPTGVPEGRTSI